MTRAESSHALSMQPAPSPPRTSARGLLSGALRSWSRSQKHTESPLTSTPLDLPDDDLSRVFVVAHSWAVASAVMTTVVVTGIDGEIATEATFPIATPASLVAANLQSHQTRILQPGT